MALLSPRPATPPQALIGDMSKLIPCSPQRFVVPSSAAAPTAADLSLPLARLLHSGAPAAAAAVGTVADGGLRFTVLGSPGGSVRPPARTE